MTRAFAECFGDSSKRKAIWLSPPGTRKLGISDYSHTPADLVILDMLMPDINGMETTLELTRQFPDVKILAISGAQGDQQFLDMARALGARRTLAKPFELNAMLMTVREMLQGL